MWISQKKYCILTNQKGGILLFYDRRPSKEHAALIIVISNVYMGVRSIIMPRVKNRQQVCNGIRNCSLQIYPTVV